MHSVPGEICEQGPCHSLSHQHRRILYTKWLIWLKGTYHFYLKCSFIFWLKMLRRWLKTTSRSLYMRSIEFGLSTLLCILTTYVVINLIDLINTLKLYTWRPLRTAVRCDVMSSDMCASFAYSVGWDRWINYHNSNEWLNITASSRRVSDRWSSPRRRH